MKDYTYKVAGVTFKNNEGQDRQKLLKNLFNEALEDGDELYDVELEEYDFEGSPAVRVLFGGDDIGSIPAEHVENVLDMVGKGADVAGQVFLKGKEVDEVIYLKESWKDRKADGLTEWEIEELKEELDYLKDEPYYSAKVILFKYEPSDDFVKVVDPEPEPEPKKKKRFSLFRRTDD